MRILQIVSSSATSGAERHTVALSKRLASLGHHVEVVCPEIDWMVGELEGAGVEVHALRLKEGRGLPSFFYVSKLVGERGFDVIHAHLSRAAYLGLAVGVWRRIPLVCTVHVETTEPVYRMAARGNNRLVAVSNYISGVLRGQGIRGEFIDLVYNGTDFHDLSYEPAGDVHEEFRIPKDRRLVGLVGRVAQEKGHELLLRAFPRVLEEQPDAQLFFVGRLDGEFPRYLMKERERMGLSDRVTFTGNRDDLPRLFDAMEFSVLPSYKESFGIAVIESMARRKPVVVSRVGGLSEVVVHEETGLIVEQTQEAWTAGLGYMLENRHEVERMGVNAFHWCREKFSVGQMVERLEAVYARAARLRLGD